MRADTLAAEHRYGWGASRSEAEDGEWFTYFYF